MKLITESMLSDLRELMMRSMSPKRFAHTLAVEEMVATLCELFCPENRLPMRAAALLHDLTKELTPEAQEELCAAYDIPTDDLQRLSPKTYHAKTAAARIVRDFPQFADPIIVAFAGDDPQMRAIGSLAIRLQSLALPIHGWVAVVNMLCAGLGNAWGAFLLATSRQGTCMLPLLFPLAAFFAEYGLASVQAIADVASLILAIPIAIYMVKKVRTAQKQMTRESLCP